MDNLLLILQREYFEHVRKKSFLIVTIITPFILPTIIVVVHFLTQMSASNAKTIIIIDDSQYFNELKIGDYPVEHSTKSLQQLKPLLNTDKSIQGILYIPNIDQNNTEGIAYYSNSSPKLNFSQQLLAPIKEKLRQLKLAELKLDQELVKQLDIAVSLKTYLVAKDGDTKQTSAEVATMFGYIMGFMMYMLMLIYGALIMQAVIAEKTSKIVEVIIASVKPMHLMMGKVLGIGAVALTQIAIWIAMLLTIIYIGAMVFGYSSFADANIGDMTMTAKEVPPIINNFLDSIFNLPFKSLLLYFVIFFVGGFLLYGGLYATVGGSVNSIEEAQQFNVILIIPVILSLMTLMVIPEDPHSGLALTVSLFPFTSPVAMMARIPFGVPLWQLLLSVALLALCVFIVMWIASKIYRIGILNTGSKVNYKTLWRWLITKN